MYISQGEASKSGGLVDGRMINICGSYIDLKSASKGREMMLSCDGKLTESTWKEDGYINKQTEYYLNGTIVNRDYSNGKYVESV